MTSPIVLTVAPPSSVSMVAAPPPATTFVAVPGVPGPQGSTGGSGYVWTQTVAQASWTVNHTLGRLPLAVMVTVGGLPVLTDIVALTATQVVVQFATPQTGTVSLV
ncbi:hypothetical protein [Nocardia sp. NPDC046763]|uniref:hypothetical protein n=1 Tax=Nocardia sp. NPDC046763 TaxID=3155256 RepID=UPI0033F42EDC